MTTSSTIWKDSNPQDIDQFAPGHPWRNAPYPAQVLGRFENDSTNNHWYRDHQKGENYDRGSSWTAFKSSFEPSPVYVDVICEFSGIYPGYQGGLIVHDSHLFDDQDFFDLPFGASSDLDLMGLGTTAISRVLPTNPMSDLPTAVGELFSEGLPHALGLQLLRTGKVTPGNVSGEYLNYSFGLLPFFRDLQAFGRATQRAEALIDEYAANAGKKLKRRYEFPTASETYDISYSHNGGLTCYLGGPMQASYLADHLRAPYGGWPGTRTDTITRSKKTWFSGCFTYYLPAAGNSFSSNLLREEAEMRHLYGGISVDTAWNLLPYSWAADWMTNAGDVIHNVAAFARDGLVMPWGYIMERCELHSYRTVEGASIGRQISWYPHYSFPPVVSTTFSAVYQRRRKATPFGFGLDSSGFTARQWSILSALGISRILQ